MSDQRVPMLGDVREIDGRIQIWSGTGWWDYLEHKDDNTFRVSDVLLDTATNPQHMFALLLPGMLHAKQQGRKIILQEPYKTMWQDHLKKNNHYATP